MITEIAILTALPGAGDELGQAISRGLDLIHQDPGCIQVGVTRGVERPDRFVITVDWTSLPAHVDGFRNTPQFGQWIGTIRGLFDPQTLDTQHYAPYPDDQSHLPAQTDGTH
jgi:heme-degrading monooxygenase HmoA